MSARQDRLIEQQQNYLDFCLAEEPYRRVTVGDKANARIDLAQLRADLHAVQERIKEFESGALVAALLDANQTQADRIIAQARQLEEDRKLRELAEALVNSLGYWMNAEEEPQECLKAELALGEWLAANPAEEAEKQP